MRTCLQTAGMDVLQHGHDVNKHFSELVDLIVDDIPTADAWRLPEWIRHPIIRGQLVHPNTDRESIDLYQVYHDCGKPMCLTVDEEGRRHYPNHAEVSKARWLECSDGSSIALYIARLIGKDMLVHTAKPSEVVELARDPDIIVLLLTALAEVHSNAAMFGGTDSTSFKIKWKHLNRIGGRIVDAIVAQGQSSGF